MWGVASFFPTCVCGVSALVLKGLTHIRVWSLLDSEDASVGPFLFLVLKHIHSHSHRSAQKEKNLFLLRTLCPQNADTYRGNKT